MNRNSPIYYIAFLACLVLISACRKDKFSPDNDSDNGIVPPTPNEILSKYSESLELELSGSDIETIQTYTNQYPLSATGGNPDIVVNLDKSMGTDLMPAIHQRDWAYAYLGLQYTLVGGLVSGKEDYLDKGLWCFIQAALLNPDEAEHLTNIAFHLNMKDEYQDAKVLLIKAKSLIPDDSVIVMLSNNLAYSYAYLNDYSGAIFEINSALSVWPSNDFLLDKYKLYAKGLANNSNVPSAPMTCNEINPDIEDYYVEIDISKLSENGQSFYAEVLLESFLTYVFEISYVPIAYLPNSLNDDIDLLPELGQLQNKRLECLKNTTSPQDACENCETPYEQGMHILAVNLCNEVINSTYYYHSRCLKLIESNKYHIMALISGNSDITNNDKQLLYQYTENYFLYEISKIWYISTGNLCEAKDFELEYRPHLDCYAFVFPEPELPFGGNLSIWFGIGSFTIDANNGNIELQLGQGWQGSFAWNFKTNTPTIGVGYGLNLDKIIEPGAFIRYTPGKGMVASIDINPGFMFVLPKYQAPSIPIAKLGCFMN
ncbi:tetratricopeptide repeat protein [Saccharicrinis sp. FJH54]|uniref:tetratricopeptide repeat protein n=1 Tax=Saccharicrinis sp. FJH54 TaxID=3344665 RepID=UPI0035D449DD